MQFEIVKADGTLKSYHTVEADSPEDAAKAVSRTGAVVSSGQASDGRWFFGEDRGDGFIGAVMAVEKINDTGRD